MINVYKTSSTCYNNPKHIGSENMSVVLAVCGNNYVKMVSDGRVVLFSKGNPTIAVNEQFNKLRRISENVILGFTGDKEICTSVLKKLKGVVAKSPNDTFRVKEIAKLLQILLREAKLGLLKIHFVVGGLDRDAKMGLCIVNSSTNFEIESYFPKYGEHQIKVSLPFGQQELSNQLINKHFVEFPRNKENLDEVMANFINDIADIDETVNRNLYKIEIHKK